MAVKKTGASATKFIKPDYIVATLFTGAETNETPLGDTYILEDVIEDTTSISQDDNETTDIECETSDSPIVSIVKQGKWQVAAEVGDTQSDLLKGLCGYTVDSKGKKDYAPATYKKLYIKLDVVFKTGNNTYEAYVVPRLQLNSKLTIESLNSNLGRIALTGTAQDITVSVGSGETATSFKSPFYVDRNYSLPIGA